MRETQLVQFGALGKHNTVSSAIRNTSCSHGWLRLLVQTVFAIIIVTSFVLIVYMVVQNSWSPKPARPARLPRCQVTNCRIVCLNTPYYGMYEEDIVQAVTETDPLCTKTSLTLNNPKFINGSFPVNWFSGLRAYIYELVIAGGNLVSIPPEAFMSPSARYVHTLVFYNITIESWVADSLVGLANLREIYIRDSRIINISSGALKAVDDTLEILTISSSQNWYPTNVTGASIMPRVTTVDFSGNIFFDVLNKDSFVGIQKCKTLYLNACRITVIGAGTFDNLLNLELLFLNNNYLVTITPGLFRNIVTHNDPKPRINLHDNLWHCECTSKDMNLLVSKDVLILDPVCVYPIEMLGKTFSEFHKYCKNTKIVSNADSIGSSISADTNTDFITITGGCLGGNKTAVSIHSQYRTISPVHTHRCNSPITIANNIYDIARKNSENPDQFENDWITFSFFLKTDHYSMIQVAASGTKHNEGLLWYESACPSEIYCIDMVPNFLRMYNVDLSADYVFCPVSLSSGNVIDRKCVLYNLTQDRALRIFSNVMIIIYVSTILICLIFGAIIVYALIRRNPNLLKGSKRIVFVKHKTVEALVLPPKVPLRNVSDVKQSNSNDDKIFVVPRANLIVSQYNTVKSTKSSKSTAPSYVSAIQPTDEQLAEWRIKHYINSDVSITTVKSERAYAWVRSTDPSYYSLDLDNDINHEY